MTAAELRVIKWLRRLDQAWPQSLQLFANNGTLLLIAVDSGRVIETFAHINCEGGDPQSEIDADDNLFIVLD